MLCAAEYLLTIVGRSRMRQVNTMVSNYPLLLKQLSLGFRDKKAWKGAAAEHGAVSHSKTNPVRVKVSIHLLPNISWAHDCMPYAANLVVA